MEIGKRTGEIRKKNREKEKMTNNEKKTKAVNRQAFFVRAPDFILLEKSVGIRNVIGKKVRKMNKYLKNGPFLLVKRFLMPDTGLFLRRIKLFISS